MGEIKDYLYDRIIYIMVGLNALFRYLGVENVQSTILWVLTIVLLGFKIRAEFLKYKTNESASKLDLELKKEQIRLAKQDNFKKERENFMEKWKKDFNETKE